MTTKVKLVNVRLLYGMALFEPQRGPNGEGEPKHSATFGFPPSHPCVAQIKKAFEEAATAKWKGDAGVVYTELKAGGRLCMHDGDAKASKEGYKGNLYITASNKQRPLIIDTNLSPLQANDGRPYSGCYVDATVEIWAQDNKFGKRLNASLQGVQFRSHGQRLSGGGVSSVDEYEAIPEADAPADAGPKPANPATPAAAPKKTNPFD